MLDDLLIEPSPFSLMDQGYLDFDRLIAIHQPQALFVTRAKSNPPVQATLLALGGPRHSVRHLWPKG